MGYRVKNRQTSEHQLSTFPSNEKHTLAKAIFSNTQGPVTDVTSENPEIILSFQACENQTRSL
jgi:hypothetical protein